MATHIRKDEVEIIEGTEAQAEGFNHVLCVLCGEGGFISAIEPPPLEKTQDFIRKMAEQHNPALFAVHNGMVVGWCDIVRSKGGAGGMHHHVGTLGMGLLPDYRGKGIGGKLLDKALAVAWARGFLRIELVTLATNKSAIALYKKFGFQPEGIKTKSHMINGRYENGCLMALVRV